MRHQGPDLDYRSEGSRSHEEQPRGAAKGSGKDPLAALVAPLGRLGGELERHLLRMKDEHPSLYQDAMATLAAVMGNSTMIDLHRKVEELGKGRDAVGLGRAALDLARSTPARELPHRKKMEERFGVDLGSVEAHLGGEAKDAAEALSGMAFAYKNVVAFAQERPSEELVAHEVAHVLQQGGGEKPATPPSLEEDVPLGGHTGAVEVEADRAAREPKRPSLGSAEPAIQMGPGASGGSAPAPAIDPAELEKAVESFAGIRKAKEPNLVEHIVAELQKNSVTPDDVRSGTLSKEQLIAMGRSHWRAEVGADDLFLLELAKEKKDATAKRKIGELNSEANWDKGVNASALRKKFYELVADLLCDPGKSSYLTAKAIYDADGSAFTDVASGKASTFLHKGVQLDLPANAKVLHRTTTIDGFYSYNLKAEYRHHWKNLLGRLVDDEAKSRIADDPSKKTGKDTISVFDYWRYRMATDRKSARLAYQGLDRKAKIGGGSGTTWWSYNGVQLDEFPDQAMRSHAGWAKMLKALALEEKWYPKGAVRLQIGAAKLKTLQNKHKGQYELRKPTALDGMMSGLWRPGKVPATGWGLTKGGVPEGIAPFLPASLIIEGSKGVEPLVPDADEIFEAISRFMSEHGSRKGRKAFAAKNKPVDLSLKFNPTLHVTLPAQRSPRYTVTNPPIQHAGVRFRKVQVTLAKPGSPEIKSGAVTMDLDTGGAVTKKGARQKIVPDNGGVSTATSKGAKVSAQGKVDNHVKGASSKLKKFLKRVTTDVHLVDDGVEAVITVNKGPSGIRGFLLEKGSVTIKYAGGKITAEGEIGLKHKSGKVSGSVKVAWDGANWGFEGEATVQDLIEGLEPFTVGITHKQGNTVIRCAKVAYSKDFAAIKLRGEANEITYDVRKGSFSGGVALTADLGLFGTATARATIANNKLTKATLGYDSPHLEYPPKSSTPAIEGTFGGTLTYDKGKFSGAVRGKANLRVPGLGAGRELGLELDAKIKSNGAYSGTIATTKPISLGQHFSIPEIQGTLKEDGSVSADFSVQVVNVGFLKSAKVDCAIDEHGFKVKRVQAKVPFGTPNETKAWGSIGATYDEREGFKIEANMSLRIKEGMIAHGTLTYSTKTDKVNVKLSVDEITLLNYGPKTHTLFEFEKQISLFSLYHIIGLYLDVGFDLKFQYEMNLSVTPTIELEGFDLNTFDYESVVATMVLAGLLMAKLIGTPKLGVGLYALDPKLLRGGGGIQVPIEAIAKVVPSGTFKVSYRPDGGVDGAAKLGLSMSFGVKGAVKPYAEFSVLDGAFDKKWEGDEIADFELLPERELLNYTVDFGGDLTTDTAPPIPTKPKAPQKPEADKVLKQTKAGKKKTPKNEGKKDSKGPKSTKTEKPEKEQNGFDFARLVKQLMDRPNLKAIKEILDSAASVWNSIKNFLGSVANFFKKWFKRIGKSIKAVLDGFKKHGFIGFVKQVLKKVLGKEIYEVIVPLLDAFGDIGDMIMDLLNEPMPKSADEFFSWGMEMLKKVAKIGWRSIGSLVRAVEKVWSRAKDAARRWINYSIQQGKIGVQRHLYYIWRPVVRNYYFLAATEYKIHIGSFHRHFKESGMITSPESVVAYGMWRLLESLDGVPRTNTNEEPETGDPWNDYWVD